MASQDFSTCLVMDDRLQVSDSINYAVIRGGQSVSSQQYKAITQSSSNIVFNFQLPSTEIIMDRRILWQQNTSLDISFTIAGAAPAAIPTIGQLLGLNSTPVAMLNPVANACGLAPFPNHMCVSVMTLTINNTSVSLDVRNLLPLILRFNDKRDLMKYNSTCPTMFDVYQKYQDAIGSNNNPYSGWGESVDNDIIPRGAYPLKVYKSDGTLADLNAAVPWVAGPLTYTVKFDSTEPLLISPLLFGWNNYNNQGMYGITGLNLNISIGNAERVWRTSYQKGGYAFNFDGAGASTITYNKVSYSNGVNLPFSTCNLLVNYISPQPDQLLPSRNVVPYLDFPWYPTACPDIAVDGEKVVVSQNLQLQQIPDKIVCVVRRAMATQTTYDTDTFLPISNVNIQFNNMVGILSTSTSEELFNMAVVNGSNQTYPEWRGEAVVKSAVATTSTIKTSGSMLILEFGTDINLPQSYYAPGSLGQFNLTVQVTVTNNTGVAINSANPYELVILTINSGVFVCERGTSAQYTGLLTKQNVLDAAQGPVYTKSDVRRLVGGGFFDSLKSIASKVGNYAMKLAPVAKSVLASVPNPYAQGASQALGALGFGTTGGKKMKKIDQRLQ